MGFSISWVALSGVPPADVLALCGLGSTGVKQPLVLESPFQYVTLPNGWTIVVSDNVDHFSPDRVRALSTNHAILGCIIEEHAMISASFFCLRGELIWQIVHDSSDGRLHLDVWGNAPPEYPSIRDGLIRKQAESGRDDVDYIFDVPIEMARIIAGFRHDEGCSPWGEITYTVASAQVR